MVDMIYNIKVEIKKQNKTKISYLEYLCIRKKR